MNDIQKKEIAIQHKLAAIFSANDEKVTIPKIYIDMTNDLPAAAVLDEIMFWTLPKKKTGTTSLRVFKDGRLWLAVRRADWWDRKRITERQSDRAIDKLIALKIVEKDIFNYNGKPTVHLRLITMKFIEKYTFCLNKIIEESGADDDENQVIQRDISDLYEMMGESPNSPFGNLPSPNGNGASPNGEIINSLHDSHHNTPSAQAKEKTKKAADKSMNTFMEFEKEGQKAKARGKGWKGRNSFGDNQHILDLADAVVGIWGVPMKSELFVLLGQLQNLVDNGVTVQNLKDAVEYANKSWSFKPTALSDGLIKLARANAMKNGKPSPAMEGVRTL